MNKILITLIWHATLSVACSAAPATVTTSPVTEIYTSFTPEQPQTALPIQATWHIQYSAEIDYSLDVDIYNLDLFDTDPAIISQLHERGIFVMCYFSAGSYEDWRSDANQFPVEVLGNPMENWAGETWLDIRRIDLLNPIIEARLDLAVQKECDGVDPDNVNGYQNDTGFPLTPEDQIAYNIYLSTQAHARGLLIGLKNDFDQIPQLVQYFDWALSEECFYYDECDQLQRFIEMGKPVFAIEYQLSPKQFCPQAQAMQFNALLKNIELDAFSIPCGLN